MFAFNLFTSRSFFQTVQSDKSPIPLNAAHAPTFRRIIRAIKSVTPDYPLLLDAMVKFSKAEKGSNAEVKTAAMELVGLAEGKVLEHPYWHQDEYLEALKKWEDSNGGCKCDDMEEDESDGMKAKEIFGSEEDVEMDECKGSVASKVGIVHDMKIEETEIGCAEDSRNDQFHCDQIAMESKVCLYLEPRCSRILTAELRKPRHFHPFRLSQKRSL